MIEIDGSYLEGGGQILRTSLALSAVLELPFHIKNIRANRPKKGMMPQHLAAVKAVEEITGADVSNISLSCAEFAFKPGNISSGKYFFNIGTAGSATLLSQMIIPVLIFSKSASTVKIKGGTHVIKSPSYEYFNHCFLRNISMMNARVRSEMLAPGFYPKGGGIIKLDIHPSALQRYDFINRGNARHVKVYIISSNLPSHVNAREKMHLLKAMPEAEIIDENYNELSAGNCITIIEDYDKFSIGVDELGRVGKPAEKVARDALSNFSHERSHNGADNNMVDQLLLYIALAGKGSIKYDKISNHARTNMYVISQFTGNNFEVDDESKTIFY